MSVRLRLTLWNLLVFTVVVVLLGVLLRERVQSRLEANVDQELARRVRFPLNRFPDAKLLQQIFREFQRLSNSPVGKNADVRPIPPIFSVTGKNLFTSELIEDRAAMQTAIAIRQPYYNTRNDRRIYTVAVPQTGKAIAVIQVSESLVPVREEVAKLTQALVALLPAALLVSALGSLLLTERSLRPVREMTNAASEIEAKDLSRRLPVRGRDEFAKLSTTFNGVLERLENAFAQQRQFVADASHELKTPLTVIKANASLALSDSELPDEARETLSEIDGAVDRTIRIVQDLLLLARADADRLPFEKQPLNVRNILEAVAHDGAKLRSPAAEISVKAPENLIVQADSHYLRQLLSNLLSNSLRHTPPTGRITLFAEQSDENIVLRVRDTGTGIAPEHLDRLGERFYRADAGRGRREGGTGLGLAICRAIAEGHGGTLKIESIVGESTTVTVTLPTSATPS